MDTIASETRLREAEVMARLDIGQKRLRALRREALTEGEHFGRDAAGHWFTPQAVALLEAASQPSAALPLEPTQAPAPAAAPRERETLRITRVWPQRERMVLCQRANGLEVVCRVQSSANMVAGMELPDCHKGEYSIWYYTGRLPRRRGRF